jgi:hypothetical protein
MPLVAQWNLPNVRKNHNLIARRDGMVMAGMLNDRYMGAANAPWPTFFSSRHLLSAM